MTVPPWEWRRAKRLSPPQKTTAERGWRSPSKVIRYSSPSGSKLPHPSHNRAKWCRDFPRLAGSKRLDLVFEAFDLRGAAHPFELRAIAFLTADVHAFQYLIHSGEARIDVASYNGVGRGTKRRARCFLKMTFISAAPIYLPSHAEPLPAVERSL
jgi:hypothetical protein